MAIGNPITLTNNVASKIISVTATADQTLFTVTGGYRINQLAVFRNGVRLVNGADFTANDGATVTLLTAANNNDSLEFQVFDTFRVDEAIHANEASQTINGNLTLTGDLTATGNVVGAAATFTGNISVGGTSPQANLDIAPASSSATLRVHARTNSSAVPAIELVRGTNSTFGADIYQDFRLKNSAGDLIVEYGQNGNITQALRVNSIGRVGVGTVSPTYLLTALAGSGSQNIFQAGQTGVSNGYTISSNGSALTHQWYSGSGESARITSSGEFGIGETSVQSTLHVAKNIADSTAINWANSQLSVATRIAGNNTANRATIYFAPYGSDNNYAPSAISASAGTSGASTLKFFTNASGNLTGQVQSYERLRIDSSGNVAIGSATAPDKLNVGSTSDSSTAIRIQTTTTGNGEIRFGDSGSGTAGYIRYAHDGNHLIFARDDAEVARFSSGGNFGVNNNSPSSYDSSARNLVVGSGSGNQGMTIAAGTSSSSGINFADGTTGTAAYTGRILYQHSTDALTFHTNGGTERMKITSDGYFVPATDSLYDIGTSSTRWRYGYFDDLDLNGNLLLSAVNPKITFNTGGPNIHAPAANTLAFNTDASNERMRIHSLGRVLLGRAISADPWLATGNVDAGQYFGSGNNFGAAINSRDIPLILNRTNTTGSIQEFKYNGSTTGFISTTSTAITISYSSDYRLKENVIPLANAITRVKQLQPKRFNYIIDPDVTVDGFIAHEAQTVVPEAVVGTHNQVDDNGDPVYQGIDPSKIIPLLTAALQEAIAKIETLETKVAALEAAE